MKKIGLFMVVLTGIASRVLAQESAALTTENATLWQLIQTGGITMIPLGLLSFAMVTFIVQNLFSLREKTLLHTEMLPELLDMMLNKKVRVALIYCRKHPSMFTNTFAAGLERCMKGDVNFTKVNESVEEASIEQMTQLMKPIDYLSIIGATSPMLGLLGTVMGMIKAFQTMGSQGMGKPDLLAANIGEALITTATGLIIAIPAMAFFFYFKKRFDKTLATLGRNLSYLFDALETGEKPLTFMDIEALEKLSD
ncbi:MAG: MotA/TolQ/ExbB proton channel family protein [Lentisphaeria bacterium]|nr:MotA/TolQ/ExbB proton channel family protein [Lentisphaeria bacterium]